jgi:hypothetical protein
LVCVVFVFDCPALVIRAIGLEPDAASFVSAECGGRKGADRSR